MPGFHLVFGNHVSLVSSSLPPLLCLSSSLVTWHFLCLSSYFLTLTLWKSTSHLYRTLSFSLVCLMFPHDYIHVTHFWPELHRKNVDFSVHQTKRRRLLICSITSDINFHHLGKFQGLSILKGLFSAL